MSMDLIDSLSNTGSLYTKSKEFHVTIRVAGRSLGYSPDLTLLREVPVVVDGPGADACHGLDQEARPRVAAAGEAASRREIGGR